MRSSNVLYALPLEAQTLTFVFMLVIVETVSLNLAWVEKRKPRPDHVDPCSVNLLLQLSDVLLWLLEPVRLEHDRAIANEGNPGTCPTL